MIICKKKRFIFAAFNKTGSSSIEKALNGYRSRIKHYALKKYYTYTFPKQKPVFKHMSAMYIRELVGAAFWDECFTFAFVRNPWDRIVSLYSYHNQILSERFPEAQQSFDNWVKAGGSGSAKRLMSDFVCDEKGEVLLDFIGRFENLEEDFYKVCEKADLKASLPHTNPTNHKSYREYYTEETRAIVGEWIKKDLEFFGYEF